MTWQPYKVYPDTKAGVIEMLKADSCFVIPENPKVKRDPQVQGVWKIWLDGGCAIVYLAGYDDPWGNTRKENDFESDGECRCA